MASVKTTVTGRLINNAVFSPKINDVNGKEQFSALLVLDPGEDRKIEAARDKALDETFEGKVPSNVNDWTVRVGDDDEYETTFEKKFINAKHVKAPRVVTRENGELRDVSPDEGLIYAGCNVAVSIDVYAYKKNTEKKIPAGVTIGLRAVMFKSHNDPLGSGRASDDEFDGIESADDLEL
jgi:hypothetical protein